MRIDDLITAAADAALDADRAAVRAARLRAAAIAEAERIRLTSKSADRWTCEQGLGVLRLDGAGKPATASISKPAEYGSWLAERAPDRVTATITVPAEQLPAALDALEFAGIDRAEAAVLPGPGASEFLAEQCVIQADPDIDGTWNVLHVDQAGHTSPVPGVTASRPAPRWVLTPDKDRKQDAAASASLEVEAELAALDGTPLAETTTPEPASSADDLATAPAVDPLGLDGRKRRELIQMCKDAGIASSGSISVLRSRLAAHLAEAGTAGA